jgi:FemAB-related protein (PEP-CTERM system-associated)
MRDLGTPVYGRSFFEAVLKFLPKDARILAIYLKNRPLAAGLTYGFRGMLEIPWVSSDRRYNHLAANMLLYSCVLEYACNEGFRVFDFGRSSPDSGTYRFKEQWGAKPVPLYWYYWLASGEALPDLSPRNPRYELAIKLWQRLPIAVTQGVGPMISPYLP